MRGMVDASFPGTFYAPLNVVILSGSLFAESVSSTQGSLCTSLTVGTYQLGSSS